MHSHFSLLDGLSQPKHIVKRLNNTGLEACALTDHGSISGSIQFLNAMKKAEKKPVLGSELYICEGDSKTKNQDNSKLKHLPVLAKNDKGWNNLMKITSASNHPDSFYHKPRLSLDELAGYADENMVAFSGHLGSNIANAVLKDYAKGDWKTWASGLVGWFQDVFGKDNFFLEVQLMDRENTPLQVEVAEKVRELAKITGAPLLATPDAHYAEKTDAIDQHILLCTNLKKTISQCMSGEAKSLGGFFHSDNFHIPSYEEMVSYGHTQEELENTLRVASMIEDYQHITGPPILPNFECPGGISPDDYLMKKCLEGINSMGLDKPEYRERLNKEMDVFKEAGISSYFLILSDILDFCNRSGYLVGPGRGSAAGCLVSYVSGITQIDPLQYGLWFERFYNAGRNTKDRVSMPDIDVDVPKYAREAVIQYIKDKYGHDKVSQMITFQTIKGRGALKAVFRAHGGIPNEVMNDITSNVPEESKISGELESMKESRGESSILQWALENLPKKFDEWVKLNDDGTLSGPYSNYFEQAMRLEGTKSAPSIHPAGVVIGVEPLASTCPMVLNTKTGQMIAGLEMNDLEAIGLVKMDILGIAMLDKIMGVTDILRTGDINVKTC